MFSGFNAVAVAASLFMCLGALRGSAQGPGPLPVHAVRSISPTDTDFKDLEFLAQEIGPARVVMLGEPTHGEGNVFEAKIRLMRFLQQRMGFTTLAFESGFYDLHKAQQELETGVAAQEALENSVFPLWTRAQEFQAVLPLVGKGQLRVAGFDPQLTGDYSGDLVDELELFLTPEPGALNVNYRYLNRVVDFMRDRFGFAPTATLVEFEKELANARRLLGRAAKSTDPKRRAEAAFWQQCLRSLLAQARDYALHNPSGKTEQTFKAVDSNPRDAQMADNLLWYLRTHPEEKVVCWGALPHFANKTEVLDTAELRQYRPMGRAVKAALGPDQVYVLGTLAGGGTYQPPGRPLRTVPPPVPGTLESELLASGAEYAFVSLRHGAPGRLLTTYAFEYARLRGPWSEVVDGFLFLKSVRPPHYEFSARESAQDAAPDQATEAAGATPKLNTGPRPATALAPTRQPGPAGGAAVQEVRGVVYDRKTNAPVPYASVAVPAQGVGTVADGEGRFVLAAPAGTALQISSVGYLTANLVAAAAPLTVRLVPAAYKLQAVQVRGESLDPRKIMKKVLAALPANYEAGEYAAEVYTHRRVSNLDTLNYDAEYVSQVFEPAGFRGLGKTKADLGLREKHRVLELREFKLRGRPSLFNVNFDTGQGFISSETDPMRTSPLFNGASLRKFEVHLDSVLDRGSEVQYVISFAAKRAPRLARSMRLISGYSGRLYVQQRDHAVLRYEALWQTDTARYNHLMMRFPLVATSMADYRAQHMVHYARTASGRYHVSHSLAQALRSGRTSRGLPLHRQVYCEEYFTPLPNGTQPPPLNPKLHTGMELGELPQLQYVEYHPAFWQAYRRPTADPKPTELPGARR